ncbi:MAG TPA: NAD(P)H-binding protein [Streptosporangiaceae bacterium]|nr:NAD(P)H-binding protein [Streptosporangiaceae bacterium]
MSVVLVTGGTGTLGMKLVPILREGGHDVRVLSRRPGAGTHRGDLVTGQGVPEAVAGAELVVHAASDTRRFGRTDLLQTLRLLSTVREVRHLLYVSIVGIDAVPFAYYRKKLACEEAIAASPVPYTIVRATQFHELAGMVLKRAERAPAAPLPLDLPMQTVAAGEVAARVAATLESAPAGRAPDFGGPEVLTVRQMAETWQEYRHRPQSLLNLRWPGRVYRALRAGRHTCPEHADGRQTWAEYVASLAAEHS